MALFDDVVSAHRQRKQQRVMGQTRGEIDTEFGDAITRFRQGASRQGELAGIERENLDESRNRFLDLLGGGQQALEESTRAAVSAGMPEFMSALQGTRALAQRRGIGTGDLGTSYEGDIFSAFQRNIANSVASQALGLYGTRLGAAGDLLGLESGREIEGRNTYLELLSGQLDRQLGERNAKRGARAATVGAIGGLGGAALGGYFGSRSGPVTTGK